MPDNHATHPAAAATPVSAPASPPAWMLVADPSTEPLPAVPRRGVDPVGEAPPPGVRPMIRPGAHGSGETRGARSHDDLPSSRLVRAADGVLEIPTGLKGARVAPPWAAVAGAALVVIVAVAVVLFTLFGSGTSEEPVATRATPASGAPTAFTSPPAGTGAQVIDPTAAASTAPGPAATTAPAAPAPPLVVHVVGEVRDAGVVSVPAGSRVQDVIKKAGGSTNKAVLSGLNLARPVVDGEQIVVPDKEGAPIPVNVQPPPSSASGAGGTAGAPIDLNTADQATLEQLDGVGPVLAQRILEWRAAHGRFTSVDELGDVKGVGDATLEKLRPRVRV